MWILLCVVLAIFAIPALTGAPYVPTHKRQVRRAFAELRPLNKHDVVVDLGSGDGVVLAEVGRAGAGGIGYEINPILVVIAKIRLRKFKKIKLYLASFWHKPAPKNVSVVYVFSESRDIKKMYNLAQNWAQQTGKNIDFISYGFTVPGEVPFKQVGSHYLYKTGSLQGEKT